MGFFLTNNGRDATSGVPNAAGIRLTAVDLKNGSYASSSQTDESATRGFSFSRTYPIGSRSIDSTDVSALATGIPEGTSAVDLEDGGTGAPLAGPYAALTLSDLLIPWATIEAQLRAAAGAGLALALYNPRSAGRPDHLARARDVLADELDPATPVVVVTAATGADESVVRTTLRDLDPTVAGMRSIVLVGTADTVVAGERLVTRRHHPRPAEAVT
jgi:precorrin-3B methylase